MDMIVEEGDILSKDRNKQDCNFNLHKFFSIELYTKWKRNKLTEKDKVGYFRDFEKNSSRQRFLTREMNSFISSL